MRLLLFIALIGRFCFVNVTPDDPPPGEMGPAMIMMKPQGSESDSAVNQSLNLHEGWNLVSWYIIPPDPNTPPLTFDDLFNTDTQPWGDPLNDWFDSDQQNPILDWVGRYDKDPHEYTGHLPELYPRYGYLNPPDPGWEWDFRQAYYIHMNTGAHPWEFTNSQNYAQGQFYFSTSSVWDDSIDGGSSQAPNNWFFLGYPLRMELKIDLNNDGWSEDQTVHDLENPQNQNPMLVLKSDDGKIYVPDNRSLTTLHYLEPGKGYFIGFRDPATNKSCVGFAGVMEPASVPGGGNKGNSSSGAQIASLQTSHFTFTPRTHWWYPIEIDTVDLNGNPMELGDEIGVFDGDLCVGATAYCDSFPVNLAAWRDDIATPDSLDGYEYDQEMTFKWYDASANQEIIFVPPPQTQSLLEDDRVAPTHSGFGVGFYAVRSLNYGVASVSQLPREFKLGQNYPNPFNAETVIPLELPQRSQVKIELYNLCGQRIAMVYEGVKNAGVAKFSYKTVNLASGLYFIKVSCEGLERGGRFTAVEKIMLLK